MGNTALGFICSCFGLSFTARPFVIDLIINVETLVNKNLDPMTHLFLNNGRPVVKSARSLPRKLN